MKNSLKYSIWLLLSIIVTEIINGIIVLCFDKFINGKYTAAIISASLIMYFLLGNMFFSKLTDRQSFCKSVIYVSIIIVISYILSIGATISTGIYFIIHMEICSPIGNVLAYPFSEIPILYESLLCIFSPISILLIWLFSKINIKNRNSRDDSL